jgi:hypothetical protein
MNLLEAKRKQIEEKKVDKKSAWEMQKKSFYLLNIIIIISDCVINN